MNLYTAKSVEQLCHDFMVAFIMKSVEFKK